MNYLQAFTIRALGVSVALSASAAASHAQICLGTPSHSSVAYDRGTVSVANSNGGTATLVGGRTALSVSARSYEKWTDNSMIGGDMRFALQFRASRVVVCPNIGVGYLKNLWEPPPAPEGTFSITSHNVQAQGGLAVGFEQPVYGGVSVTPYAGARYAFRVWYLDSEFSGDDVSASGDTTSSVELEYGLSARYRNVFLGWSAVRDTDNKGNRPASSRLFVGLAWGLGKKD